MTCQQHYRHTHKFNHYEKIDTELTQNNPNYSKYLMRWLMKMSVYPASNSLLIVDGDWVEYIIPT